MVIATTSNARPSSRRAIMATRQFITRDSSCRLARAAFAGLPPLSAGACEKICSYQLTAVSRQRYFHAISSKT
jgi:hypothetical protein